MCGVRIAIGGVVMGLLVVSVSSASAPLPPVDAKCAADAECGVTFLSLDPGPYQCCIGCGTSTTGNKAWVSSVQAVCRATVMAEHRQCPALACPSGPMRSKCDHGTCKLVTP